MHARKTSSKNHKRASRRKNGFSRLHIPIPDKQIQRQTWRRRPGTNCIIPATRSWLCASYSSSSLHENTEGSSVRFRLRKSRLKTIKTRRRRRRRRTTTTSVGRIGSCFDSPDRSSDTRTYERTQQTNSFSEAL
jgi:hypothetical protein